MKRLPRFASNPGDRALFPEQRTSEDGNALLAGFVVAGQREHRMTAPDPKPDQPQPQPPQNPPEEPAHGPPEDPPRPPGEEPFREPTEKPVFDPPPGPLVPGRPGDPGGQPPTM